MYFAMFWYCTIYWTVCIRLKTSVTQHSEEVRTSRNMHFAIQIERKEQKTFGKSNKVHRERTRGGINSPKGGFGLEPNESLRQEIDEKFAAALRGLMLGAYKISTQSTVR